MIVSVPGHGPQPAKVLVVGEHPSVEDERKVRLFSGQSGNEFYKMLQEAGHLVTEIRFASLLRVRPYNSQMKYVWTRESAEAKACMKEPVKHPDKVWYTHDFTAQAALIWAEIEATKPNVIIALGEAALWYLTGEQSVSKWRGSLLQTKTGIKVIPTYSPAQIMRMWEWRVYAVRDLERARTESEFPDLRLPELELIIRPTFEEAMKQLDLLLVRAKYSPKPVPIAADIETIARNIACIGFAWSTGQAMCIPLMDARNTHYYSLDEEVELVWKMKELCTHPNVELIWQNGSYDLQHIIRSWGFRPNQSFDTLLGQHAMFPGLPKDLGFQASMYCRHYVYWKDELTDYRTLPTDLDRFWRYNAKDCITTFEIAHVQKALLQRLGFQEQSDFLHRVDRHAISMMIRGVRIDKEEKSRLMLTLMPEIDKREKEINFILGQDFNISSPKQMKEVFYDELKMKTVLHKKTKRPSTDKEALPIFAQREPILQPLVDLILETRSIGVFNSTFVMMKLDTDGRMRCSYSTGGPETYRFASSKNPFGTGGNLQNIPKGDEDEENDGTRFVFPNCRRMFTPDPGYEMFDVDLAGADAQVVAWEAEDDDLKAKFRAGLKIHAENAKDIYGRDAGPDGKKPPYYKKAKMGCHLTNYGGKPPTLSKALGMTIHEAELFQRRWFQLHPGIKTWHLETENSLMTTRSVRNKFGFRRYYPDRVEGLLPQALAWVPQSTIAIVTNTALCRISEHPETTAELLLQTHDSLTGQYPKSERLFNLPIIKECLTVTIPYSDPLIIGTSIDLSLKSWGDLQEYKWSELIKD